MPRFVRGSLNLSKGDDPAFIQYNMLLKDYIYRARIDKNGSFEVIIRDFLDKDGLELLKNDFNVKEIVEVKEIEKLEI